MDGCKQEEGTAVDCFGFGWDSFMSAMVRLTSPVPASSLRAGAAGSGMLRLCVQLLCGRWSSPRSTGRGLLRAVLVVALVTTSSMADSSAVDAPASVDWRDALTPVKNQGGTCGSCWAFAIVAAVEAVHAIHSGWKLSLSEQQLLDCDLQEIGCTGGFPDKSLQWIIDNGGITGEGDYPYTGVRGVCDSSKLQHYAASITGYMWVESYSEKALMLAVAAQPVIVSVDGSAPEFKSYSGGIYDGPCGTVLNHALLVVGYGDDERGAFWIAKNSWGSHWGDGGYIYLRRDVPPAGMCGLALKPIYPTI